jgi:hypothetical protein
VISTREQCFLHCYSIDVWKIYASAVCRVEKNFTAALLREKSLLWYRSDMLKLPAAIGWREKRVRAPRLQSSERAACSPAELVSEINA